MNLSKENINPPENIEYINKDSETFETIKLNIDKSLIIFCNPISGNQEGKIFLNIAKKYIQKDTFQFLDFQKISLSSEIKEKQPIKALFFNLIDKEENLKGQNFIKDCITYLKNNNNNTNKVKIIFGGGDGSVLQSIQQLKNNDLDLSYCVFSHLPLGTGNDLANSLGFGKEVLINEDNLDSLYNILIRYYLAKPGKIDVWKLTLKLNPERGELKENKKDGKKTLTDENNQVIREYKRIFINYVSFGYDARVGFGFDGSRTKSRCCNKCVYFCEGVKNMCCCCSGVTVKGFLDYFAVLDEGNKEDENNDKIINRPINVDNINVINKPNNNNTTTTFFSDQDNENSINHLPTLEEKISFKVKYMFKPKNSLTESEKNKKVIVLKGSPCSIICQNINHYMGGTKNIWKDSGESLNVEVIHINTREDKKKYTKKLTSIADKVQKLDDKKLEFFTFDNGFETGLGRTFGGFAKKLYSGHGPIYIKFKEIRYNNNENDMVFFNVDGEYFMLIEPIAIRIELDNSLCDDGQLPFLIYKN